VQEDDRGLLLHEMGLGKTMQVISALVAIREAVSMAEARDLVPMLLRH
jgi:SNF2 family DNA or RNA helicase